MIDSKTLKLAMEEVVANIDAWPEDDWVSISEDVDLNLYLRGNHMKATLYPVSEGHTDTSRSILIFDLEITR